jgi:hypothetical protein
VPEAPGRVKRAEPPPHAVSREGDDEDPPPDRLF